MPKWESVSYWSREALLFMLLTAGAIRGGPIRPSIAYEIRTPSEAHPVGHVCSHGARSEFAKHALEGYASQWVKLPTEITVGLWLQNDLCFVNN